MAQPVETPVGDIAAKGGKPDPMDTIDINSEVVAAVIDRNFLATVFVCGQWTIVSGLIRSPDIISISARVSLL